MKAIYTASLALLAALAVVAQPTLAQGDNEQGGEQFMLRRLAEEPAPPQEAAGPNEYYRDYRDYRRYDRRDDRRDYRRYDRRDDRRDYRRYNRRYEADNADAYEAADGGWN